MPASAPSLAPACATRALDDIATSWGYSGQIDDARTHRAIAQQSILGRGHILNHQFSSGLRLCASDLWATRSHIRTADAGYALMIFMILDDQPLQWQFATATRPGNAHAGVLAIHEHARLIDTQYAFQRRRCIVVQAIPEELRDPALAQQVHDALRGTRAVPFAPEPQQRAALLQAIAEPDTPIAHLLQESCSLSLLAHGLRMLRHDQTEASRLSFQQDLAGIKRVRELLIAQPAQSHTLASLAIEAGVSVSTLKAKFPQLTGSTVFDFLREQRLALAYHGLKHQGWSVKQAAYQAGYRYPANFSLAFRKRYGIAPNSV